MDKPELRAALKRTTTPPSQVDPSQVQTWDVWRSAQVVAAFMARHHEPSVQALVDDARARGVRIALPRVTGDHLVFHEDVGRYTRGSFGIPEPDPAAPIVASIEIDVWLVPGLAFDLVGNRLGFGKGHYDRVLVGRRGSTIGIAHASRVLAALPADPWDIPMDAVLTDQGWALPPR